MMEVYVRLIDGDDFKVLTDELLAKILRKLRPEAREKVRQILGQHAVDRDFAPFAPEYIKWVAMDVRRGINKSRERKKQKAPTKELFADMLAKLTKGFQANKGKIMIARNAWSKFNHLSPKEYSEEVFRKIITETVAARKNFNAERSVHFRRINHLKKMERKSIETKI